VRIRVTSGGVKVGVTIKRYVRERSPWLAGGLPGRKSPFDRLEKADAALERRVIHVIVREVVTARARRTVQAHGACEEPARRVAHQKGRPTPPAIGADHTEPVDVVQAGDIRAIVLQSEADAGQEHFINETLEDRRKAHVPDRKRKDQRVGFEQALDISADAASVPGDIVVVDAVLSGHHRIEPFGVEVAIVDLVAMRPQGLNDRRMQAGAETRLDGMGE